MQTKDISISSKRVAATLGATTAVLLIAHCAVCMFRAWTGHDRAFGIVPLFDFWEEGNIPTVFSGALLATAALLLCLIYLLARDTTDRWARRWAVLSWAFLFLAVDEVAQLHEQLSEPIQRATGLFPGSFEYWAWVVPYSLLALLAAVYFLPFFLHFDRRFRLLLMLAATLFVSGAIGFEIIEGLYVTRMAQQMGLAEMLGDPYFVLMVTLEEFLEMCGVIIFIYALLEYLRTLSTRVLTTFTS